MSTFQGIEMAKKALFAQQGGLHTTGHNIANANTRGYTRQRVDFNATTPFPVPSRVMPNLPGQLGTGVEIGTVQRIRDMFLDSQYRSENSRLGYWGERSEAISRIENLLNEPSDTGISKAMDSFWESLQELSANPDNSGAREVVAERGLALTETFNYISKNMQTIQGDLKSQIDASVDDINSIVRRINGINEQIQKIEPHGLLANDLYDDRDLLLDELSQLVNIKVHYRSSSDSALEIADGLASIEIVDESGASIGADGVFLIDLTDENTSPSDPNVLNELSVGYADNGLVGNIDVDGSTSDLALLDSIGSLSGLIKAHGYTDDNGEYGIFPDHLRQLDDMAREFAEAFNDQHASGLDVNQEDGLSFFNTSDNSDTITAENITVNKDILEDTSLIAAAEEGAGSRNGENALKLAELFDVPIEGLGETSVRKYFSSMIGKLGVEGQEANRMKGNTEILQSQIDNQRQSVSAVSLDEEISNLVKFQHAYNAAARNMTAIDEMLDRIINNMGLVGR